jgi:hypothetical protein
MATNFVTTKDNYDSIYLSVDVQGLKASTTLSLNGNVIKTVNDSFQNEFIGTNKGLNGNHLTITISVFRYPADLPSTTIIYNLTGAANVSPNNPDSPSKNFIDSSPFVTHYMEYYF